MKDTVLGVLAHVDAGKTTLSEAMLFTSGSIRKAGRVDHGDAYLDTESLEKERGITIFSKQAIFTYEDTRFFLLDTPGHADFSTEMERTLQVLDYALLVISAADGVQGHTRTLWRLLRRYDLPVFIFVNKTDIADREQADIIRELRDELDGRIVDFCAERADIDEQAALSDDDALAVYLENGAFSDDELSDMISGRRLFPVWFGSALRMQGIDGLLSGLCLWTQEKRYPSEFGAKVFKIARDPQGARLAYIKITGGTLRVKDAISPDADGGRAEKADQIRLYSGSRFSLTDEAPAGTVCAVTGLSSVRSGDGLGTEEDTPSPALEPVLTYKVILPEGCDPHMALAVFRTLEEEDPMLRVMWAEEAREINVQLMGEIQLEVLGRVLSERFGLDVSFGSGSIVYKETIAAPVRGIGHFEPLRHYAEVHLKIEPGAPGSGIATGSACPEDFLARSWQRLIMTHLKEKTFVGVLTGSELTDVKITLLTGRAHLKHTEGGDFREATYRAVRHGLMQAESILLEPWYSFRLDVPLTNLGRGISDMQQRHAENTEQTISGDKAVISGIVPASEVMRYSSDVISYTHGKGSFSCGFYGYRPCHDSGRVIEERAYDPERDVENTPDSVFCSHGAGFIVKWRDVVSYAHLESDI